MKSVFLAAAAVLLMAAAQPRAPFRPAPQAAPAQVQPGPQPLRIPTRVTVRVLLGICTADNGACLTYVLGAADAWASAAGAMGRAQLFCFPAGTSNQQIAQSTVQYLRARPQESESNAGAVVLNAFMAIYPCPR